eukprot:TRINITY_DN20661_c0_g2_i2.p1 TRINITY_DN20661_c0_g2~~TRINITY_DN20661_c0_g2_i2.p1  ORF type:complete len:295 (+),score=39.22 TRINITY_DN20661_c0_g2_i2:534-1418(+)
MDPTITSTWQVLLASVWVLGLWISVTDPSNPVDDPTGLGPVDRLTHFCPYEGCACWYLGERRYHCSRCNKCTLGFDHHCEFLNCCIGNKNYPIFFVLLAISSLTFALMGCSSVVLLYRVLTADDVSSLHQAWGVPTFVLLVTTMMVTSFFWCPMLGGLLVFHCWLIIQQLRTGQVMSTLTFIQQKYAGNRRRLKAYRYDDEQALVSLQAMGDLLGMNRALAWKYWREMVEEHRHATMVERIDSGIMSPIGPIVRISSADRSLVVTQSFDDDVPWFDPDQHKSMYPPGDAGSELI